MKRALLAIGVIFAVVAAFVIAGSQWRAGRDAPPERQEAERQPLPTSGVLDGRSFTASRIVGYELLSGTSLGLSFDAGRISFSSMCNLARGGYRVRGDRLHAIEVYWTMKGCGRDLEAQDRWLGDFIDGAQIIGRGASLELRSRSVRVVFAPRS